jgi:peptide/nickel transport system ATP-binding protein
VSASLHQSGEAVLEAAKLTKYFEAGRRLLPIGPRRIIRAVDGVSFTLGRGRTLSLVGESGSGKTTTARLVLGLERPTSGTVMVEGRAPRSRASRGQVQAVFQDPATSLDPRMRVAAIVAEPLGPAGRVAKAARRDHVLSLLDRVGLGKTAARKFPHEFSGGQRQRIAIARALAPDPHLIVLDEPVSSLDVSIRAQIINLLIRLQQDLGTSYLMISHDLASVRAVSDDVAVMYAGRIVEQGATAAIFATPKHPYTQALMAASYLKEETPSPPALAVPHPPLDHTSSCAYWARCPLVFERCLVEDPQLRRMANQVVACHLYQDATGSTIPERRTP